MPISGTFWTSQELQKLLGVSKQRISSLAATYGWHSPVPGLYEGGVSENAHAVDVYLFARWRANIQGKRNPDWDDSHDINCPECGAFAVELDGGWKCIKGHHHLRRIKMKQLTIEGMKSGGEHAIAKKEGYIPLPVVEFGDYSYIILFSELIHPGHNTAEVINVTEFNDEDFEILVTRTDRMHAQGNAWVYYGEEGGVFVLAVFTADERSTLSQLRAQTAVLSYRIVQPTSADLRQVQVQMDEEMDAADI